MNDEVNKKTWNNKLFLLLIPAVVTIPGGLLLGLGIGLASGNEGAGVLAGLGGGIVIWGILAVIIGLLAAYKE